MNTDGIPELIVGSAVREGGSLDGFAPGRGGSVYILSMRRDGTVQSYTRIRESAAGFTGTPHNFAWSLAVLQAEPGSGGGVGTLLAVGAAGSIFQSQSGEVYMLRLASDYSVTSYQIVAAAQLGTSTNLGYFGATGLTTMPDLNFDGFPELAAGKRPCSSSFFCGGAAGVDQGKVFILYFSPTNGNFVQS